MKFVYVLISDEKDYYSEQASVSMLSLKKHNPGAEIVLVTDSATRKSLEKRDSLVKDAGVRIIEVDIPERYNKKSRSRYIKTSLVEYIDDDFLYIDSDTVINGDLTEIEKYDCDIGAVFDRNGNGESEGYMKWNLNKAGIKEIDQLVFYNGGVIFSKNTLKAKKFFNDWHNLWLQFHENSGLEIDQVSFLKANQINNNIIQPLPGIYNCQLVFPPSIKYLVRAKILHYIADFKEAGVFPMEDTGLLSDIRQHGITSRIEDIINNPVEIFLQDKYVITAGEKQRLESKNVILAKELTRYYPWTNKIAYIELKIWAFFRIIRDKLRK